jgi:hypothetical protein
MPDDDQSPCPENCGLHHAPQSKRNALVIRDDYYIGDFCREMYRMVLTVLTLEGRWR